MFVELYILTLAFVNRSQSETEFIVAIKQ